MKAVAKAFDRNSGDVVSATSLRTYADAVAQYHISPESKFLNADYLDRGTTRRRHIRMVSPLHIGKEAHDWERQAILGMSEESIVLYGVAPEALLGDLNLFIENYGYKAAANALRISLTRLRHLIANPILIRDRVNADNRYQTADGSPRSRKGPQAATGSDNRMARGH